MYSPNGRILSEKYSASRVYFKNAKKGEKL